MPVEDESSPPPKGRKPVPVAAYLTPSPPVQGRIKRVKPAQPTPPAPAPIQSNRRFQQQADEDSDGQSSAQESNSSDDADEADLSNISHTSQHPDAEAHVYAAAASSQGGYPTPMHMRRGADRGLLSLAGDIPFVPYHNLNPKTLSPNPAKNPLNLSTWRIKPPGVPPEQRRLLLRLLFRSRMNRCLRPTWHPQFIGRPFGPCSHWRRPRPQHCLRPPGQPPALALLSPVRSPHHSHEDLLYVVCH